MPDPMAALRHAHLPSRPISAPRFALMSASAPTALFPPTGFTLMARHWMALVRQRGTRSNALMDTDATWTRCCTDHGLLNLILWSNFVQTMLVPTFCVRGNLIVPVRVVPKHRGQKPNGSIRFGRRGKPVRSELEPVRCKSWSSSVVVDGKKAQATQDEYEQGMLRVPGPRRQVQVPHVSRSVLHGGLLQGAQGDAVRPAAVCGRRTATVSALRSSSSSSSSRVRWSAADAHAASRNGALLWAG